jgi:hypothetical protein
VVALIELKAADELGVDPKTVLHAQWFGAGLGLLIALPAYFILARAYGIGTSALPVPTALGWKAVAQLSTQGAASLPPRSLEACLIAGALGVALGLAERVPMLARWLPSPIAVGVALLVPFGTSSAMALGAVVSFLFRSKWKSAEDTYGASLAAGAIGGESVAGLAIAAASLLRGGP